MKSKPQDAVKLGIGAEATVLDKLNSLGLKAKPARGHMPYDILLSDGRRVEVKTRFFTSKKTSDGRPVYDFILCGTGVDPHDRADFFICVIIDEFFVIPTENLDHRGHISIQWPTGHMKRSKWAMYHNQFDLLKEKSKWSNY